MLSMVSHMSHRLCGGNRPYPMHNICDMALNSAQEYCSNQYASCKHSEFEIILLACVDNNGSYQVTLKNTFGHRELSLSFFLISLQFDAHCPLTGLTFSFFLSSPSPFLSGLLAGLGSDSRSFGRWIQFDLRDTERPSQQSHHTQR